MPTLQMDNPRPGKQQMGPRVIMQLSYLTLTSFPPSSPPPSLGLPEGWASAGLEARVGERGQACGLSERMVGQPGEAIFCCFSFLSPVPNVSTPFLIKKELMHPAARANGSTCFLDAG